jgi:hypothetical protein
MGKCVNCGCDAEVLDSGVAINREATKQASIVRLKAEIARLEKDANRTPPKTLVKEWDRVRDARVLLTKARTNLERLTTP